MILKANRFFWSAVLAPVLVLMVMLAAGKTQTSPVTPPASDEDLIDVDIVTITDVNAFVTQDDLKNGITRTEDLATPVKMSHQKHERAGVQCIVCHHKKGNDDRIKQCAQCHRGEAGLDTMHAMCIGCHEEKQQGPQDCAQCHQTGTNEGQ